PTTWGSPRRQLLVGSRLWVRDTPLARNVRARLGLLGRLLGNLLLGNLHLPHRLVRLLADLPGAFLGGDLFRRRLLTFGHRFLFGHLFAGGLGLRSEQVLERLPRLRLRVDRGRRRRRRRWRRRLGRLARLAEPRLLLHPRRLLVRE